MKKRRIIRKLQMLRDRSGVTMVELIVVFALISMFVALSSQVITSSLNVYAKIQGIDYGRQVSDTIMNKIVGELSGAQNNSLDEKAIKIDKIDEFRTEITFRDESGSLIRITSGKPKHYSYNDDDETEVAGADYDTDMESQLIIHYCVTKSGSKVVYQPVDWTFDENMYQGYEIESLKFSDNIEGYPSNMICVELTLNHPSYGEYAATRFVECYNFEGYEAPTEPTPEPTTPDEGEESRPTEVLPDGIPSVPDVNEYWPYSADSLEVNQWHSIPQKGFFLWPDGHYYIVVADNLAWDKSSWRTPGEASNPEGESENGNYSWQVVQWSGRAYSIDVFNNPGDTGYGRENLQRGDLVSVVEDGKLVWYLYTNTSSDQLDYDITHNPSHWYKIKDSYD